MPATSGPAEQASGASGTSSGLAPGSRWQRDFPGEERQLGVLRRWLTALLPPCPARDDVVSVANELGSNAIRHTLSGRGGRFAVEVTWYGPQVRVAVADGGAPAGPRVIDDPAGEHGRGLLVVHQLSAHTGECGDEHGRLVWADIPWGDGLVWPFHRAVAGARRRAGGRSPGAGEGLLAMTRHSTQSDGDASHDHR